MNKYKIVQDVRGDKSSEVLIGSSDIPTIYQPDGGVYYNTPLKLYREKIGIEPGFGGNEATAWGHALEPIVLGRFLADRYGKQESATFLRRWHTYAGQHALYPAADSEYIPWTEARRPDHPWAIAHADLLVLPSVDGQTPGYLVEVKTGRRYSRERRRDIVASKRGYVLDYAPDGLDPAVFEGDAELVDINAYSQIQWQLYCYGLDLAYNVLYTDGDYRVYRVPVNPAYIEDLVEAASAFRKCCLNQTPPTPRDYGDIKLLYPDVQDTAAYVSGELLDRAIEALEMRKRAAAQIKQAEAVKAEANNTLGLLIGDSRELCTPDGHRICTQVMFDRVGALQAKDIDPEDLAKYQERGLVKTANVRYIK